MFATVSCIIEYHSAEGTQYAQPRVKRNGTLGRTVINWSPKPWKGGVIAISLAFAFILTSCGKQENSANTETATSGKFQLVADEVLKPAIDSLVVGFMIENPGATVTVKYTSATEAVLDLLDHETRAIIIDRQLTPAERLIVEKDSVPLPDYRLAEDGIGCIVSAKNPAMTIRKSDLQKMFAGEPTNWGDVTLVLPAYPSSTEYVLDSMLNNGNEPKAKYLMRFSTSDSIAAYVASHPKAVGFIGSAWKHLLEAKGDSSIKVLPVIPADSSSRGLIEPVLLHMAYIAEGLYPLVTKAYGYSFQVPNTLPRGFLAYASTAHGQTVFKNFDVLPITQPIRLVPSK
jgi:phosphate transport system substrate-binding protein